MLRRIGLSLFVVAILVAVHWAPTASADGDPGSDVLVNQTLFFEPDAGVSIPQQEALGGLLQAAVASRFPIRVAIIATPQDLGAITGLWRQPRAYARFLGLELSQTYAGRLLVVMPNGFGFNWPGHSSSTAYQRLSGVPIANGNGLASAAEAAVSSLAAAAGVRQKAAAQAQQPRVDTQSSPGAVTNAPPRPDQPPMRPSGSSPSRCL